MKHPPTLRLRCLAAMAIAAVAPLAAQAQTSTLTISVGPEPRIDTSVTCKQPTDGTLVPVVRTGHSGTNSGKNGELIRFTTDPNELVASSEVYQSRSSGDTARVDPVRPAISFSWTRSSSNATNKYIQIKAKLPSTLRQTLSAFLIGGGTLEYTEPQNTVVATTPDTGKTASHASFTGLPTINGTTIKQRYDSEAGEVVLTIAPSDVGDATFLPEQSADVTASLDLTLLPTSTSYHLKENTTAQPLNIQWTCAAVSSAL